MTALTCEQMDEILDLYAVDECDPSSQDAVQAHLDDCPRCRHELDRARSLSGLLDLHFRQDEGLARLEERLRHETRRLRPAWTTWLGRSGACRA